MRMLCISVASVATNPHTPLYLAQAHKYEQVAELLRRHGAPELLRRHGAPGVGGR